MFGAEREPGLRGRSGDVLSKRAQDDLIWRSSRLRKKKKSRVRTATFRRRGPRAPFASRSRHSHWAGRRIAARRARANDQLCERRSLPQYVLRIQGRKSCRRAKIALRRGQNLALTGWGGVRPGHVGHGQSRLAFVISPSHKCMRVCDKMTTGESAPFSQSDRLLGGARVARVAAQEPSMQIERRPSRPASGGWEAERGHAGAFRQPAT